jgi:hypothetical protein
LGGDDFDPEVGGRPEVGRIALLAFVDTDSWISVVLGGAVKGGKVVQGFMGLHSCAEGGAALPVRAVTAALIRIPCCLSGFGGVRSGCAYELGGMYLPLENIAEYNRRLGRLECSKRR